MEQPIFDARDPRYKTPYGAVPSGTAVCLTLRPLRRMAFSKAQLVAEYESKDGQKVVQPMEWEGYELEQDIFTTRLITDGYVGLVWYSFTLIGLDGRRQTLGPYQLTVYDGSEGVPDWFGQGMCYQIFPDRFRRTRIPDAAGMVGGRQVHTAWQEEPEFRPDQNGEIRNRDFFGGDLKGVMEKLDYLSGLGVETIYFCPIFEAAESHRYGTADYTRIDPMLGTEEDFVRLCDEAHKRGMKVMLDGVFNHTGYVSRYFNGDGFYPEAGASQSEDSPYRSWFNFSHWPDQYESWWGIYSLPSVNENDPGYREFIFGGENSVVRRWLRAGADGWRLDVADELPDDFVHGIHAAARAEKPSATIIGEVWEDGSTKVAYGVRRRHILGGHCDGLMNYPFRNAAIDYFLHGNAANFIRTMESIRENYPPFAFYGAMNSLGTHDTPRILTLLGDRDSNGTSREWRSAHRMDRARRARAKERLKAAAVLLFSFPGAPTVYYGDEAGMEGYEDPFNRRTYPWGQEDHELIDWFTALGALRKKSPALRRGDIRYLEGPAQVLAFTRTAEDETLLCAFNAGDKPARLAIPGEVPPQILIGQAEFSCTDQGQAVYLPPRMGTIWRMSPRDVAGQNEG